MGEDRKEKRCPKCGSLLKEHDNFCSNCGTTIQKKVDTGTTANVQKTVRVQKTVKEYEKSYNKLKETGGTIASLCVALGILMLLGIFPTVMNGGSVLVVIFMAVMTFLSGSAIKHYFDCTSEMAKNIEKQTELLEKLNEKLDK